MVQNYLNTTMDIKDREGESILNGFIYIPVYTQLNQLVMVGSPWLFKSLIFVSVARVRLLIWLKTMCLREMLLLLLLLPVYKLNENDGKEHIFQTMINWLFWQIAIVYCIDPFIIAMMRAFDAKNLPSKSENETRKLYRLVEMKRLATLEWNKLQN